MNGIDPALLPEGPEGDAVGIDPYAPTTAYGIEDQGAWGAPEPTSHTDQYAGEYYVDASTGYAHQYAVAGPSKATHVSAIPAYAPYGAQSQVDSTAFHQTHAETPQVQAPVVAEADYWYPQASLDPPEIAPLATQIADTAATPSPSRDPRSVSVPASASASTSARPPRGPPRGPRGPYKKTREKQERLKALALPKLSAPVASNEFAPDHEPELDRIIVTPRKAADPQGIVVRELECSFCQLTEAANKKGQPEAMISCVRCGRSGEQTFVPIRGVDPC